MNQVIKYVKGWCSSIDWILIFATLPVISFGLITMYSFVDETQFFSKQIIWLAISATVFVIFSLIDFKFLRRTQVVIWLYFFSALLLALLFVLGSVFSGAQSWFSLGGFSFQPAELSKVVLILILAKYFSRRHIEIKNIRHIIVSGVYAFILFGLVALQPDFGSALIILFVWFGMVLVSGISKKHLIALFLLGAVSFFGLWTFVFQDYQKDRIMTFVNPLHDIQGAGYNAYQSQITVGSGQVLGKGIGYGTQSRLKFLPEYQTDFIFAAFSEEWGFVGILLLFASYGVIIWRILANSIRGATNFEILFGLGLAILLISHFLVHVGMNIGLLPITGLSLPLMSYGGTNLVLTFASLGILMSMKKYARAAHSEKYKNEVIGI